MKRLSRNASDEDILDGVREWVALLAEERYAEAHAFIAYGADLAQHWTPTLLMTVIRNCGSVEARSDGRTFRVTPLADATGGPTPCHDVHRFDADDRDEHYLGIVWFDLPLNGEWSDLTATFDLAIDGGEIVLELDDIHVM
jgi:hypothetical protein